MQVSFLKLGGTGPNTDAIMMRNAPNDAPGPTPTITPICADICRTMTSTVLYQQPRKGNGKSTSIWGTNQESDAQLPCRQGRPTLACTRVHVQSSRAYPTPSPPPNVPFPGQPRPGQQGSRLDSLNTGLLYDCAHKRATSIFGPFSDEGTKERGASKNIEEVMDGWRERRHTCA
ncbi:hypothetical protein BJV77DRAFT_801332 [Russula vinacea]|nr:hypothetical protein BJV77DRAFT_801332 [Russula vinacea]